MLLKPTIWLSGVVSGAFHLVEQPIKRAIVAYSRIKKQKKLDPNDSNLQNVNELRYAWSEIKTMIDLSSFKDAFISGLSSFKRNRSAFNPRLRSRYQQEVYRLTKENTTSEMEDIVDIDTLSKLSNQDALRLSQIIKLYGTDNNAMRKVLANFLEEVDAQEPLSGLMKFFDIASTISFRAMGTVDDVYRVMGTMRALRAEAMQKALVAGKKTEKEINEFIKLFAHVPFL